MTESDTGEAADDEVCKAVWKEDQAQPGNQIEKESDKSAIHIGRYDNQRNGHNYAQDLDRIP